MPNNNAFEAAQRYLQEEPDTLLRAECEDLIRRAEKEADALSELEERFLSRLAFGTAGLRGKMEAGYARLNRVSVAQAAYAIGKWVADTKRPIVVGFDGRLNSPIFAREVVGVLEGLGFSIIAFAEPVATPICAFAVKNLGAAAGVMITASHNPPSDNGVKVYGPSGAQIRDEDARNIETYLRQAPSYSDLTRPAIPAALPAPKSVLENYFAAVQKSRIKPAEPRATLRVVYTPLHGVGHRYLVQALASLSFVQLIAVEKQKEPDGGFPTLAFPNPEEDGALDLALKLAEEQNADLIIANDPDADRLAVCARSSKSGSFVMMSGNELGAFLGCDILENMECPEKKLVVSTLVSSRLLSAIASACDASYDQSLTGFSRVAQIAQKREETRGERFVFGFEEALGYCLGDIVRDKDGISAAVHFLDRAAVLKKAGVSVWDELDRIAVRYGLFRGIQWSFRFQGALAQKSMAQTMDTLRKLKSQDLFYDGQKIVESHDLLAKSYQGFSNANIVVFELEDHTRVIARPSGTEPKLKFYVEKEARVLLETLDGTRARLDAELLLLKKKVSAAFAHQR